MPRPVQEQIREPMSDILTIHENHLEKDCEEHPKVSWHWGQCLAIARKTTKQAKNDLKLTMARISKEIRLQPGKYGIDKITEAQVDACILMQHDTQVAQKVLIDAEYEEEILEAFMSSLRDRKSGIEDMVKLHGQMYWSKPNTSGEDKQASRIADMTAANKRIKG